SELSAAETRSLEALEIYRAVHNRVGEAIGLLTLGTVDRAHSNFDTSRSRIEASREIASALGDSWGKATVQWHQGELALAQGHPAEAAGLYRQAPAAFEEPRTPADAARAHRSLAKVESGERRQEHLLAARKIYESLGREDLIKELS